MRQNFDTVDYDQYRFSYVSEANPGANYTVTADYPIARHLKSGGNLTSGPIRLDGTFQPNACDLLRETLRYKPGKQVYKSANGYVVNEDGETIVLYDSLTVDKTVPFYLMAELTSTQVSQDTVDEAVAKWYNKLADFRANIAADIATWRQTADGVASITSRLAEAAKCLRRRNLHGLADALGIARPRELRRNFAGAWLQLQYGWLPLLSDVYELVDIETQRAARAKIKATVRRTGVLEIDNNSWNPPFFGRVDYTDVVTVRALASADNPLSLQASQLGLDNPALLAWELLPYSFILDWYIPVSGYLQNANILAGFDIVDPCVTRTRYMYGVLNYPEHTAGGTTGTMTMSCTRKVRTLEIPSHPIPSFSVPAFDATRFTNALALLSGFIKGTRF